MNLYLLEQDENNWYDTYDSIIVCAATEDDAKKINPSGFWEWSDKYNGWVHEGSDGIKRLSNDDTWANSLQNIKCTLIGKADDSLERGVVLSSFNAG